MTCVVGRIHIRMDLREIGWEVRERIHMTQDRNRWRALVNTVMKHLVP
jgi:hypothetical protein